MAITTNARRITKIYHGSAKVYQDDVGVWKPIKFEAPFTQTVNYLDDGKGSLYFSGYSTEMFYVSRNGGNSMKLLTIPSSYKNIRFSSVGMTEVFNTGSSANYGTLSIAGNTINIQGTTGFGSSSPTSLSPMIVNYDR
ncbi:hypothetical protein [Lentilactobacillus parabuchneri]|uniref:hypothetical protein n=1 Tax=Lentilactobacillus parabuchneri TaxID=152331 RepID=UPI00230725BD|nr:hypothetical protein [Lentilactobacillus parabuchneri]MDB1102810.1 hypothetical protein [Lentilactobacillus parabuchneri]